MKKRQNEAKFVKARPYKSWESNIERTERYATLRAPLPAIRAVHAGRSWGGSAICSEDGQRRLQTPGTRAYELMWQISNEG